MQNGQNKSFFPKNDLKTSKVVGKLEKKSGVNFTNILLEAFKLVDPESVKKIDNLTVFFTLLGSASVKAVCKTLKKLSPEDDEEKT